jgi:O-methyltransferase
MLHGNLRVALRGRVTHAVNRVPVGVREPILDRLRWIRQLVELGPSEDIYDRRRFFRFAFWNLAFNQISGDYVEFGSWSARSFRMAYDASRRASYPCWMWSFDSFEGLPAVQSMLDEHPRWTTGAMSMSLDDFVAACRRHGIPGDVYRVVPGWYDQTLAPDASGQRPDDVCLAYIDCDLYSSTRVVLEFLRPRLKHGMILAFDDYFAWSASDVSGERRALSEFMADLPTYRLVPFLRFGPASLAFVVESSAVLPIDTETRT